MLDAVVVSMLERWAEAVERFWYPLDEQSTLGCYGPGYIHWGVQSNFNYAAAMATLAAQPGVAQADHWRQRALAALRFALATHLTGDRQGLNGEHWGHSWISMLGIERAMHGIDRLSPFLTLQDQHDLQRVLVSESNWLLHHGHRGGQAGVLADLWNSSGRNAPESNIWSGALLWRTAQRYPGEAEAAAWQERAHDYFINGVSIPADAEDDSIVAGKRVGERTVGANFFPNYALDHHGYLNVGYMAICISNVAILHFDMKQRGEARPESLDHHMADLWQLLRRLIFPDGRLARIGGDSRVRYTYCQEYLLPTLLYAADRLQDPHALDLAEQQVDLMQREMAAGDDGTFYGRRLRWMAESNPHYFTRLESDRACVLAMLLNYRPLVEPPATTSEPFEASVAGSWIEPEHGAAMVRNPNRLASFSWRAYGLTQALCLPPAESDLAEWSANLCPVVRYLGDDGAQPGRHRRLLHHETSLFAGGFVTAGAVMEGVAIRVDEGANCTDQAVSQIAFAALPDGHTCLGLQYVTTAADRVGYTVEVKSLHLNVPNDLFNGYRRRLQTAQGELMLSSPPESSGLVRLQSPWLNIDDTLGVVHLYGGEGLLVDRTTKQRGGRYPALFVEEICLQSETKTRRRLPGETVVDVGFAVIAGVDAQTTAAVQGGSLTFAADGLRGAWIQGIDGVRYALVANFAAEPVEFKLWGETLALASGAARVLQGQL